MKALIIIFSFIGLALTLLPSFFVFNLSLNLDDAKILMLIGSICWLALAPLWINKKETS
ncbi:MAG: hypothetical protein R3250_03925 [Melioribacteraceae bacterium]|nr:hypothetical protein [Melioribacteraceae bacterium]